MLAYQLRLAWKSLLRNPILSLLMIFGIALGIAVSMTFVTAYYNVSGDPIPQKSDRLFYVQLDFWNPDSPYDDDDPREPPNQLTYRDATAIRDSSIPTFQTAMYKTNLTIHPEGEDERPFREQTRMCFRDFFPMFDVPFAYGGPWGADSDQDAGQVVVLGDDVNHRLFDGENSVGRKIRIEDRDFEVVGVLEPWYPVPKFYDTHNETFGRPEEVFMPFMMGPAMEMRTAGNTSSWNDRGSSYQDLMDSEAIWTQYWVQLDDEQQKEEYLALLDAYVREQGAMGRQGRPENILLRDVMAWLHYQEVVPGEASAMLINAILFLLVCSVNLIGILLGKFLARAPEVGVRRALGASRTWVFVQHLLECELIGLIGCALGLAMTFFGLDLLDRLFGSQFNFGLDVTMLVVAVSLAIFSAMIAGIYPAWRICRIQPGLQLKAQ
jgi:putative ABC transport system permease protein